MRFYSLTITNPSTGQNVLLSPSGLGFTAGSGPLATSLHNAQTTSNPNLIGLTNLAALNIEFDLPIYLGHEPQGGSLIRLWGLGVKTISQAANLNPVNGVAMQFALSAGMAKGLPLANPAQSGLIAAGEIWQAFGNWQGTNQTLDIIVQPGAPPGNQGIGINWNWQKGQNLQDALTQMMAQAFPSYTPDINISATLVAPSPQPGCYRDFAAFSKYLHAYTKQLGVQQYGESYPGVSLAFVTGTSSSGKTQNTLQAFDGQGAAQNVTTLAFQDLVGQPTWIDVNTVTFQTVLRADLQLGDMVTFPTGVMPPYALTTPSAAYPNAPTSSSATFQGLFSIIEVHHYANFRQADAASWNTTFTALYVPPTTPTVGVDLLD